MIEFIKKILSSLGLLIVVLIFFWQFVLRGYLPIPSDALVGLYHPFRDFYSKDYSRGIPFKNFLITDPVRQIIPWKNLSVESMRKFELPLWNPYEMAGKPHLANFQSGSFYFLNLILLIKPLSFSWSLFVMIQPILAGIFMIAYLRNLKLDRRACLLGGLAFSFSGFSIAWLEWGNIGHTALWLPLILLSIDKVFQKVGDSVSRNIWGLIFLFSMTSSFFAGHLQIFFYLFILSLAYLVVRWFEYGTKIRYLLLFIIYYLLFAILTAIQWVPTFQFISLSARSLDQNYLNIEGWFLPWEHVVQFVIPDFFGNPTTLNYWGTWNYGELVGYVGVTSLIFISIAIFSAINRIKLFFLSAIALSFLFVTQNPISKIPFDLAIPFVSSAQPTRLIFLISFGLSVLSAMGFDALIKEEKLEKVLPKLLLPVTVFVLIWLLWIFNIFNIPPEKLLVTKRNLVYPSVFFSLGVVALIAFYLRRPFYLKNLIPFIIIILAFIDLLRFGSKFTPFTNPNYFYPQTKVIEFLKKDKDVFRIASTDSRIFPPNFSTYYKIQSIEGYDPLYLKSYAELIAASERGESNIKPPFGFNRIITPHNIDSKLIDFLNVKYILSLTDLDPQRFNKVFQEGETRVYENKSVSERAFFVSSVVKADGSQEAVNQIFAIDLNDGAVVDFDKSLSKGSAKIIKYSNNEVIIETQNQGEGFLVLADTYYPTWKASVDEKNVKIYKTNHSFRGILVPSGKHEVRFYMTYL